MLLWASAFVAIRHLGPDFSPGALSLGRLLAGSACLAMVALGRGLPRPSRNDLIIGVLWSGVYNVALNAGEQRVDAGTAVMLIQVSPVLIAFLAALFLSERFTAYLALGLALAFGGVALIAFSASPGGNSDVVGVLLCLIAAVVYSVSLILQKPLMGRMQAVHVTWLSCTVGAISCLPVHRTACERSGRWPESFRNEVINRYPRLELAAEFVSCFEGQAKRKPECAAAGAIHGGIAGRMKANILERQ